MTLNIVVLGLSLSSSWGNGHATTWRALLKALAARGHDILFLERDRPWYAQHRDMPQPDFCALALYDAIDDLDKWRDRIQASDLTIIGSYVPDGIAVARLVRQWAPRLAFYDIDTPVTMAALRRGNCDYLTPALIPAFDLYLSFTGGPILRVLEQEYGSPVSRALYCAADDDLYRPPEPSSARKRWDLGYLGTYSEDRQPALERLLLAPARLAPHRRFVVAGPQYPATIDWPANVERIDHLPPADHAAFYGALAWTLNITRADMIEAGYSPSVRLFEAASCATPIISDIWDGIGTFFEDGREIILARGAADIIRCLGMPDDRRNAIGQSARQRLLQAHTAEHRAREMEQHTAFLKERRKELI